MAWTKVACPLFERSYVGQKGKQSAALMVEQDSTEALDLESGTVVRHTPTQPPSVGGVNGRLRRPTGSDKHLRKPGRGMLRPPPTSHFRPGVYADHISLCFRASGGLGRVRMEASTLFLEQGL